eukprot:TRINITY_DN30547_c0_g2_i1.p1 TRINITY_DN30547_c0_g2~~TRINITY_DN30547_c0_g2_i1.p1  ORF type:complete len:524 (+),score=82.15 TRINITY_DN30547_c0_g2_i1:82-1572(+)
MSRLVPGRKSSRLLTALVGVGTSVVLTHDRTTNFVVPTLSSALERDTHRLAGIGRHAGSQKPPSPGTFGEKPQSGRPGQSKQKSMKQEQFGILSMGNAWLAALNEQAEGGLGSALLMVAAFLSIALANLPDTALGWTTMLSRGIGPAIGAHALSVRGWVNEGLMSLFFFQVGLEMKKEFVEGSLSSPRKALLPCIGALGGMVVPMLVYYLINIWMPGGSLAGITVPMATDIAFALGVFSLFCRQMPSTAKPFLLTLATVDDLGAIAVIALCFAGTIVPQFLFGAVLSLGLAYVMGKKGVKSSATSFWVPGLALWYCLLRGGVNSDIAGFLAALCVPMRSHSGEEVVERLAHRWAPVCTLLILPLFALVNCAVPLGSSGGAIPATGVAVSAGIALGLLIGKPVGIFMFSWLSVKSGLTSMPAGVTKRHLLALAMLGGIGFTMCLFLIENSLVGPTAQIAKLAMIAASLLCGGIASGMMMTMPKPKAPEPAAPAPAVA